MEGSGSCLWYYPGNFLDGLGTSSKNLNQDLQCAGWDSNWERPTKSQALNLRSSQRSLRDVKTCIQIEVYRRSAGKYYIHSEARRASQSCNQCPFSGLALVSLRLVPVGFPSIPLKVHTWTMIFTCGSFSLMIIGLTYSSILKMKTVYSSEISVNFYPTARCHIPELKSLRFTRGFTTNSIWMNVLFLLSLLCGQPIVISCFSLS